VTSTTSTQPSQFSSQIPLQAPSSVLPPSITPFAASSIVAPSSLTPILPNAGDVTAIQPPGSNAIPSVGASPSSGASGIVPPSGSVSNPSRPVLPPSGSGGVNPPVGTVIEGSSDEEVKPLTLGIGADGRCSVIIDLNPLFGLTPQADSCTAHDLEEANAARQAETELATGQISQETIKRLEALTLETARQLCKRQDQTECDSAIQQIGFSEFYNTDLTPGEQLRLWQTINQGMRDGLIGVDTLKGLAQVIASSRLRTSENGDLQLISANSLASTSINSDELLMQGGAGGAIQFAGEAVKFTPFIAGLLAAFPIAAAVIIVGVVVATAGYIAYDHFAIKAREARANAAQGKSRAEVESAAAVSPGDPNDPCKDPPPELPENEIVNENGVVINHNYRGEDHGYAHFHVYEDGKPVTRVAPNGKSFQRDQDPSGKVKRIIEKNISKLRRAGKKIGRWLQYLERCN
jgi:hypothetical protein